MSKKVSVIIPTYNYGHFIPSAINSVLQQNYPHLEIIVIDDGSTDKTKKVVSSYGPAIKYFYQKNSGLSSARNIGIEKSTGEYILFLDSDDMLGEGLISLQIDFLEQNPDADISVCRNRLFARLDKTSTPVAGRSWKLYKTNHNSHLCHLNIAPPHAFFFRREVILKTGFFDTKLKACEDYDFIFRAVLLGFVIKYNHSAMVYYRKHAKSMSKNCKNQLLHDSILHNRVHKHLVKCPDFLHNDIYQGLILSVSGMVRTAVELKKMALPGSGHLMQLAQEKLSEAKNHKHTFKANPIVLLAYVRIMCSMKHPVAGEIEFAKRTRKKIQSLAKENISKIPLGQLLTAFLIDGYKKYSVERREILILIVLWFRNCFF